MAQKNRTDLKAFFETGDKPTQSQFADLIDSFYNIDEDDSGWQVATLQNGFSNFGQNYAEARYRKKNGVLYIEGLIRNGNPSMVIFNLPVGFRPSERLVFPVVANFNMRRVDVYPNGDVEAVTHHSTWMSLAGISFVLD